MAKLRFYFSAMNAGKSTRLLQAAHNYEEQGMTVWVGIPAQVGKKQIDTRLGISRTAEVVNVDTLAKTLKKTPVDCVLIDEAQFLTQAEIWRLTEIVHQLHVPVLCYGLRTDFQGNLFEGSQWLLAWADEIEEIKTICHCGKKATMNIRIDLNGKRMKDGEQVVIDKSRYQSVCMEHFIA